MKKIYKYRILWAIYVTLVVLIIFPIIILMKLISMAHDGLLSKVEYVKNKIIRYKQ